MSHKPRVFSTDSTCFLAVANVFENDSSSKRDPNGITIAASLFDAIVNASELRLCLALDDGEHNISGRLSNTYKNLIELVHDKHFDLSFPITSVSNNAFEGRRDYVAAAFDSFAYHLTHRPELRSELLRWFSANAQAGGPALRPVYSFRREYVAEKLSKFASSRQEISESQWLYCFDFVLKNEPYCRGAVGTYIPHSIRSLFGLHIMNDARPQGVAALRPVDVPISIKFADAIIPRLKAGVIRTPEHLFEIALRTRAIVDSVHFHSLPFAERAGAATHIANEAGAIFPAMSELQRDWSPVMETVSKLKSAPQQTLRNYLIVKGVTANLGDLNQELIELSASVAIAIGENIVPIIARLKEHVIIKSKQIFYCPLGSAFEVKIDNQDETRVCSLNTDFIHVGTGATVTAIESSASAT
ncbi:MAG: hypothetical protein OEL76_17835 [Siculibacillus sp.]|nr:hypothetical protein [Siculibacillus sp.]